MKNSEIVTSKPHGVEFSFDPAKAAARFVSGKLVCEEALKHGRMLGLYWSASGQVQRENITARLPAVDPFLAPLHTFELEIDGQSLHNRWEWAAGSERPTDRPGGLEAVVELRNQLLPVTVKLVTRLDGSSVITRWLEITNTGESPAAISRVSPFSGMLWNPDPNWNASYDRSGPTYSLGHFPEEVWGQEGNFTWQPLPNDTYRITRSLGRSHGAPYFVLRNEVTGEFCFIGLAWSGNWFAEFANRPNNVLTFSVGPKGPAPLRVIAPGETVVSPKVHLGMFHSDLDVAVNDWHAHVRASVLPPRPAGKEMYTVAGRVVEEPGDWMLREIDIAAEMGCEAFMVDAGWYGTNFGRWPEQRGDWFIEGSWLPGGMAGLKKRTSDRGMLFGLWIEAETFVLKSKVHEEHPEWVLKTDGDCPVPPNQEGLNLAIPEAAQYVRDSVIHVVRDYELDFLKLDYNISSLEGGQNLRDGFAEHESWRHFEVLYDVFDQVRAEYPNVALENCAGGGGRNDLGIMSRFHYCCESDESAFPQSIRTINSMTMFLPPEAICYYHNHLGHAHQTADLDTHLRVTLFATPIFVGFGGQGADRTTDYFAKTRRYIELAKTFCRPVMANRPIAYHHTPDIGVFRPADWCVLEYGSGDHSRGYAGVFKLSDSQEDYVIRLRGVDLSTNYEVTLDNAGSTFRASGKELALSGLPIRLDAALTSELVMYQALTR